MSSPHPPRRARWAAVAAATACSLLAFATPVGADPLPLSDPPAATLACVGGSSVFTIHWPVGEYGAWDIGDPYLGELSGPGGTFTVPTDESFVVPAGWSPNHSTIRLNRDTVGNTSYNQYHLAYEGGACPFSTPVSAAIDCASRTLTASVPAGHVTQFAVYDQDGGVIYIRQYPRYNRFGVIVEDVRIGPATLTVPTPLPSTVTSVTVVLIVDNTELSTTLDTSCAPVAPPGVEVRGGDGSAFRTTACDGTVTIDRRPGSITVVRTGPVTDATTVSLTYAGSLAAPLAAGLPASVRFEPGQQEVAVPVPSDRAGTLDVTIVPGSGYVVGSPPAATVRIVAGATTDPCLTDPGPTTSTPSAPVPSDPGPTTSIPAGSPSGASPPVGVPRQGSRPVADPEVAPPAEVIAGTARLTG